MQRKKITTRRSEASLLNIDYKDVPALKKFLSKFSKIVPRAYTGNSLKEQKALATAIKRARYMALLPYVVDYRASAIDMTLAMSAASTEVAPEVSAEMAA